MLETHLGITLNKSETMSNWAARPLRPEQIEYALSDVRHMLAMHQILTDKLEKANRLQMFQEHLKEVTLKDLSDDIAPAEAWSKIRSLWKVQQPRTMNIIKELAAFRELHAQNTNRQTRLFLRDDLLLAIAEKEPNLEDDLLHIQGMDPKVVARIGKKVLSAVRRGMAADPATAPVLPKDTIPPSSVRKSLLNFVDLFLSDISKAHNIAQSVLIDQSEKLEFVMCDSEEKLNDWKSRAQCLKGWRNEIVGQPLLGLRAGKTSVTMVWNEETQELISKEV
jgi:ribonuclease D